MPEIKKRMIKCPKCGKEIEIDVWNSIEMPYDIDQKESILRNIFFKKSCDTCKIMFPIGYRCAYNDMEKKYLIWIVPRMGDKEKEEISLYNQRLKTDNVLRLAQGGYRYRIVRNDNELREKIVIFDAGLDDRYIETMKLVYVPEFRKNITEDSKIMGIYFDIKPNGSYQWVLILNNQRVPLVASVDMNIYEDMKVKLKDYVEELTPDGLVQIYALWARKVLDKKIEASRQK